jgi:Asp/Glu/hydantoin racemase
MERHDWKLVDLLPPPYSKCIVSGFTDGPFLDFGVRARAANPNVGINVSVLKDAARFVGMVSGDEYEALEEENRALRASLDEAREEAESAKAILGAIDTFESAGFRARRKPGRKAAEKTAA